MTSLAQAHGVALCQEVKRPGCWKREKNNGDRDESNKLVCSHHQTDPLRGAQRRVTSAHCAGQLAVHVGRVLDAVHAVLRKGIVSECQCRVGDALLKQNFASGSECECERARAASLCVPQDKGG